ncbi:50S ribosomal protein L11 methyltransferase [Carnobacterium sp. ISL-102]|uniref:50S ribosomal protein L11 methyltransferase n=1 Tax=Carnobacterium sp. ISL-102 TaxID=2819142 RepID=UPI001BEB5FB7|nr:50S ribosomal protein L11 methyltransferase [Carnobacterium sp. ISL-102]MBT2731454.1 50S ribosomal protein L11 methyltransferase [Carnobacterium sp. ISL-102]
MKWIELQIQTSNEAVEAVSNILIESGSQGVAIEDRQDFLNNPDDGFGEIWALDEADFSKEGVIIKAYFPDTLFLPELVPSIKLRIEELKTFGLNIAPNNIKVDEVAEENWATAWKKYYHPLQVTRFLTVVPSWEDYDLKHSDERVIRLDPGLAFGTGTHPTTMLSLQALETYIRGDETILDVGTGSGVLSIASKALGAKHVHAYDLDDVAVKAAVENIELNEYAKDIIVKANDLLKGVTIEADIVVANILAEIIIPLIPEAFDVLKPGGLFLTSGIIEDKKELILSEQRKQGFTIIQVQQMKDWCSIVAQKPLAEDE